VGAVRGTAPFAQPLCYSESLGKRTTATAHEPMWLSCYGAVITPWPDGDAA